MILAAPLAHHRHRKNQGIGDGVCTMVGPHTHRYELAWGAWLGMEYLTHQNGEGLVNMASRESDKQNLMVGHTVRSEYLTVPTMNSKALGTSKWSVCWPDASLEFIYDISIYIRFTQNECWLTLIGSVRGVPFHAYILQRLAINIAMENHHVLNTDSMDHCSWSIWVRLAAMGEKKHDMYGQIILPIKKNVMFQFANCYSPDM